MRELSLSDLTLALARCADAIGDYEFIVVGSLAILGALPDAPPQMRVSHDIDLYSKSGASVEKNRAIYARFGPDTEFAIEHDFYIEPVGEWTTRLRRDGKRISSISLNLSAPA